MGLLKPGGTYTVHPEGVFTATVVDYELKEFENRFREKDSDPAMVQKIVWKLDTSANMEDGRPYRTSYFTTLSLNEKANLYKFLGALGFDPEDPYWAEIEDINGFSCTLGAKCLIQIKHKPGDSGPRDQIAAIMPIPAQPAPAEPAAAPKVAPKPAPPKPKTAPVPAGVAAAPEPNWDDGDE